MFPEATTWIAPLFSASSANRTDRRFGPMLSSHVCGGQIVIPGVSCHRLPSRCGLKFLEGLVQAPCSQVFVSRGVGTVGLPFRFRRPPEVNLLTLTPASAGPSPLPGPCTRPGHALP